MNSIKKLTAAVITLTGIMSITACTEAVSSPRAVEIVETVDTASVSNVQNTSDGEKLSKKVLFVGNSYTFAHNMPEMIAQMALSTGDKLIYAAHTPGGAYIKEHANNRYLQKLITTQDWDYVTIQTQSQESANKQTDFDNHVFPQVQRLVQQIHANDPDTIPLFFMTWGYENGVIMRCILLPYFCTFNAMNDKLQERYTFYASETHGAVTPSAAVWRVLRDKHSELNLYESDGNHPSLIGVYANAVAFYTMIFEKDPTQLTFDEPTLDNNTEALIKAVVKSVVYDQRQHWDFSD